MAGNTWDLKTRDGVVGYMREASSEADWNERCDEVKRQWGGEYPEFWYAAIVLSGLMRQVSARWR